MNRSIITFFLFFLSLSSEIVFSSPSEKIRLVILTDIENEPDDAQSMVRLLTYSNHFEIEALIATTSIWMQKQVADWRIYEIVDTYGKVEDNLKVHEKGYPSASILRDKIKKGRSEFGMEGVGKNKDSEGSEFLLTIIEKQDPRPIWIAVWGGANVLAQTLWQLEKTKSPEEASRLFSKIRIYTISDQDDSGPWIRKRFPNIFYIVSPGYEENHAGQYHYATWSGISGDKFHGRFDGPDFSIVDNPWLDKNIRNNHGPLGAEHPHTEYLMEGDTPSFLGLINNGLNSPENPNYGGWGGRYELYIPHYKKYMYEPETRPIWTNVQDEVYSPLTKRNHTSNHATIWRWREAYQNDFAARIDWSNTSNYKNVNHPPTAKLNHETELTVKSGQIVNLDASKSSDPDDDYLQYNWIYYREVGTLNRYRLEIKNQRNMIASFRAPEVDNPKTAHFILEAKDDGKPPLTSYKRVIVRILPLNSKL